MPQVTQLVGPRAGLKLLSPVSGSTDSSLPPVQFSFKQALSELTGPVRHEQGGWAAQAHHSENAVIFSSLQPQSVACGPPVSPSTKNVHSETCNSSDL